MLSGKWVAERGRWLLPAVCAPPMMIAAQLSGRDALVFPEVLALGFGAWSLRRPDVLESRWRIAALPTACAALGIAITGLPAPRWMLVAAAVGGALLLLTATRTRIAPAVSAAALPVVFDVRDPAFLLVVAVSCCVIAVTAPRLEPCPGARAEVRVWPWRRIATFWLIAFGWAGVAWGVFDGPPLLLAAPLMVACLEIVLTGPVQQNAGLAIAELAKRVALLAGGATVGAAALSWIPERWLAGATAAVVVGLLLAMTRTALPPVYAMALVPFVADLHNPLEVAATTATGAAVLLVAGWAAVQMTRPRRQTPVEHLDPTHRDVRP